MFGLLQAIERRKNLTISCKEYIEINQRLVDFNTSF